MKFNQLSVQNFLALESAVIQLKDKGLHLIQGKNNDDSSASSNGAGKSSLVDALCWCLFGQTARGVKGDTVVNRAAKKDCRVQVTFEVGHTIYSAIRHRKHGTFKNGLIVEVQGATPSDPPVDLSRGTDAETQKVLESILGCSYEVFMAAVYSGQEVMPDLPRMKDRELKTLIEEAAGLQRIERAYEESRAKAVSVSSEVTKLTASLESANAEKSRADVALVAATEQFDAWELARGDRVAQAQRLWDGEKNALEATVDLAKSKVAAATIAATTIKEIDEKLSGHKTIETNAVAAEREAQAAELALNPAGLRTAKAAVERIEGLIANAESEISKPCSECGTVLKTMPVEEYIAHREKHLIAAKRALEDATVKEEAQKTVVLAKKEIASQLRKLVPDVSALIAERAVKNAEVVAFKKIHSDIETLKRNTAAYFDQASARSTEANPHASAKAGCETRVENASNNVASVLTSLKISQANLAVAAAVVKVFGPAGVRAQILDTVTPFLNDRTADYLSILSDGEITATWTTLTKSASGDLKEKFSIDVTHAKGGDSFAELSGGEKRKVRLATALALQDLVASRATQPIDLFIGDEIDDALDPAGLERLMTILERKARERGTVLVISHSDLRDWIDNVTIVTKSELWKSTVEGSLCS
jgi:DNA repair exonuclease SbcCD ATPase subunit